jgi:hypothetical protein
MTTDKKSLNGVNGWLKFYVITSAGIGPLLGAMMLHGNLRTAERANPYILYAADWAQYKQLVWLIAFLYSAMLIWAGLRLFRERTPAAVEFAKITLWITPLLPILDALVAASQFPGASFSDYGGDTVKHVIGAVISSAIWITYFNKSERVRITYGFGSEGAQPNTHVRCPECSHLVPNETSICPYCDCRMVPQSQIGSIPRVRGATITTVPNVNAAQYSQGSIPTNTAVVKSQVVDENAIYAAIANELKSGNTDQGLWIRLFAECDGDENKTKVAYIKQRAASFIAAKRLTLERAAEEQQIEEDQRKSLEDMHQLGKSRIAAEFLKALHQGHPDDVREMLSREPRLAHLRDDEYGGRTVLMVAGQKRYGEIVQLLLDNGADLNATTRQGQTAEEVLRENGYWHG